MNPTPNHHNIYTNKTVQIPSEALCVFFAPGDTIQETSRECSSLKSCFQHSSAEPSASGPEKGAEDGGRNKGGVAEASANAGGGSGIAKAGGTGGGAKKGRFGLDKIIAIVAFAFAIIALILTILLHL